MKSLVAGDLSSLDFAASILAPLLDRLYVCGGKRFAFESELQVQVQ